MSAAALITEARAAGVYLSLVSRDRITWACAGDPPPNLLSRIRANKTGVLAVLRAESWFGPGSALENNSKRAPAEDPHGWRDYFEERAGIREYDGGMSRTGAEAGALADCVARWRALNPVLASGDGLCVQCGKAGPDTPVLAGGGHAWLHRECWGPMNTSRNEIALAAVRALLGDAP